MSQSTLVVNYNSSRKSRDDMLSQQSLLVWVGDTKGKGWAVRGEVSIISSKGRGSGLIEFHR